jgi:hypothetical protein
MLFSLGGFAFDADALAFITATAISDTTQQLAINQLVLDIKSYGSAWTKLKGIYPIVGGTATTHKYNLKDPRDLDAAYRLSFSGGWTHSSTGAKGNGTNTYADTYFNTLTENTQNDLTLGVYSRTNISENSIEIGNYISYLIYNFSGSAYKSFNSAESVRGSLFTPTTGMLIGSRINSSIEKYYQNGVLIDTINISSVTPAALNIWLGNYSSTSFPSSKEYAGAILGGGLTDSESIGVSIAFQTFNTSLSRQV